MPGKLHAYSGELHSNKWIYNLLCLNNAALGIINGLGVYYTFRIYKFYVFDKHSA